MLVGASIAPPVTVQVTDGTGAVLPGAQVSLTLLTGTGGAVPGGVSLSGAAPALTDAAGNATFAGLSVNQPGSYALLATATVPGAAGVVTSAPFTVSAATAFATVTISDTSSVFTGGLLPVTVTTVPVGLATSVTYNGSPTQPTAIGAYNVVANVTAPGYAGSATAVKVIASTLAAGGPGGGAYPASGALSCGPGVFANGLRAAVDGGVNAGFGSIGYALTSGQLLCGDGNHPAKFGGGTTPNADLVCPAGQNMVGIEGGVAFPFGPAPVVGGFAPRCQLPTGGAILAAGAALPSAGSSPFVLDCPAGSAVTGVVGGQGAVVDSVALVCATVPGPPPTPTITSFSPAAQVSPGQMLTINGTNLPASSLTDVVFNQGGPDIPAQYMWGASPTRAVVRLPSTLTVGAPTTVRVKNPADTLSTAAVPLNITVTPGTPVLSGVWASCAGGAITSITPGTPFAISGQGIDTSNGVIVWTPIGVVGVPSITQNFLSSTGGPGGEVCSYPTTPSAPGSNIGAPALTPGNWLVTIRYNGIYGTSADSNGVLITVP